jgi:cytosine/adenosine deaminase-related metal-dependent hydrolase
MEKSLELMIKTGTTTIGAISSQSLDFQPLKNSPIKKVIFNEIIASQPHQVDSLFQLFLGRLEECEKLKDEKLTPAVAIHSPFSVHHIVVKKVLELAKEKNYLVSAHFMESQAERDWLDNEAGEFYDFYKKNYGVAKKFTTAEKFLGQFDEVKTIFTHCNYLNEQELKKISEKHSISHCPVSNRLLGGKKLDVQKLDELEIDWNISTDGLSSNFSLNLFDELRTALFIHENKNVEDFAFQLLNSVTKIPAKQLKLNSGDISVGKDADMILIELKEDFDKLEKIPLHIILKQFPVYKTFILGKETN